MFISRSIIKGFSLPTRSIILNSRLIHSTTKPTVPINPPADKTTSSSSSTSNPEKNSSVTSNNSTSKIPHLSDNASLSEEIVHSERLGLKPEDILRETNEKKESQSGGKRGFHSSARQQRNSVTSDKSSKKGSEDRLKGGSEGVKVGEGNVGKDGGEGKKEEDRSVSDESRLGESDLGKVGGDKFGGGGGEIGSNKRQFSTSVYRRVEGEGTGSKGTPKGVNKGEGLEHLENNQPSESEESVHADKHSKNPLDELDDSKKAAPPKK